MSWFCDFDGLGSFDQFQVSVRAINEYNKVFRFVIGIVILVLYLLYEIVLFITEYKVFFLEIFI